MRPAVPSGIRPRFQGLSRSAGQIAHVLLTRLGNLVKLCRAGDRALQLLLFNEEYLVSVSHQLALITSLPFVHTAVATTD